VQLSGNTTYVLQWRSVTGGQTSTLREWTTTAHTSGGSSSSSANGGTTTTTSATFVNLQTLILGAGTWFFAFTGDVEPP